jgi:hypothetical protein
MGLILEMGTSNREFTVIIFGNYFKYSHTQIQPFGGSGQSIGGRLRECGLRRISHWEDGDPAQNEMPRLERGLPGYNPYAFTLLEY